MPEETSLGGPARPFPTTDWTLVLQARDADSGSLEALFIDYWKPVYGFFRRKGLSPEDAKDAAQGLFAAILERRALEAVHPARGRFRTFVRMLANRFLADEGDWRGAAKRGGGWRRVPLETVDPPDLGAPPDRAFLREWADTLIRRALHRLREEVDPSAFELFRDSYASQGTYAELASPRGISVTDVTNRLHQTRLKFRDILLREVRRGVASDADVESEIRDLFENL